MARPAELAKPKKRAMICVSIIGCGSASNSCKKTNKLDDRDPDKAYLEIPNVWKLNPLELARLQLLAKWRQETAMARN